MGKFSAEFIIRYSSLGSNLTLSFPKLMDYLQDASTQHTNHAGFRPDWFTINNQAWVITQWDVVFHKLPEWNDRLTVETWPSSFKSFVAERSFSARLNGELVCTALSDWIFTDLTVPKPLRPTKEIVEGYGDVLPSAHIRSSESVKTLETLDYTLLSRREMTVGRRDIDTNNHVNNLAYIIWAYDDIPDELFSTCEIKRLQAAYKKECRLKDRVIIETSVCKDKSDLIMTKIINPDGFVAAEVFTRWGK